ncbi:hypothetical protein J7M22_07380 [Candidatus Poribacteria bacterium]|nr:hypothetical protein [Candidatus Poribacteria bacterium]
MAKIHHCIDVGMMAVQNPTLPGLQNDFVNIYTGDSVSAYQACNRLHSYGYDFDTSNNWGAAGANRAERNAIAWANYVKTIENANNQIGNGNLKGIISRPLTGLYVERGWSLPELDSYVRYICDNLTSAQKSLVAGWYLDDDGLPKKDTHTVQKWKEVINTVHTAQKCKGVNWPFFWADDIDGDMFWYLDEQGWHHRIPDKLKDWVDAFPSDATPIFMPYYYPWSANNWKYTVWPPWRKWQTFMNNLNDVFPVTSYPNLKFQPVLEAWQKKQPDGSSLPKPGHVDMHKQIRVVLSQVRVNGIWFLGWYMTQTEQPKATESGWAKNNWTQSDSPCWAEAIQNEPEAQTEGISDAIPGSNQILQNYPNPFTHKSDDTGGTRIPYHLAQRASFQLKIYNVNGQLVRTIDEGYTGISPQGKFENGTETQGPVLNGTSAYWDGKNNQGEIVSSGTYYCYLVVDGVNYGPITMTKQ